jgi:hypothetical protein
MAGGLPGLFLGGAEGEDELVAAFGEDGVVVIVVVSFVERSPSPRIPNDGAALRSSCDTPVQLKGGEGRVTRSIMQTQRKAVVGRHKAEIINPLLASPAGEFHRRLAGSLPAFFAGGAQP